MGQGVYLMNKYVGKSLICDTSKRDGHVFFYEDYFEKSFQNIFSSSDTTSTDAI